MNIGKRLYWIANSFKRAIKARDAKYLRFAKHHFRNIFKPV